MRGVIALAGVVVLSCLACGKDAGDGATRTRRIRHDAAVARAPGRDAGAVRDASPAMAYAVARARARELAREGKHGDAAQHYVQALAALPNDPIVTAELGWTAYKLGDRTRAVALLEQAARTGRPYIAARALDDIGRIQHDAGNKPAAAKAYEMSLQSLPDLNVLRRRGLLDVDPLPLIGTRPMRGPMKRLSELCKGVSAPGKRCVVVHREALANPPRPISEAFTFVLSVGKDTKAATEAVERSPHRACGLALRTARGWYVDLNLLNCSRATATQVAALGAIDEKDGRPAVRVEFVAEYRRGPDAYADRMLSLCGIGASGDPSCTIPLAIEVTSEVHDGAAVRKTRSAVTVTATTEHLAISGSSSMDGEYPLTFP